jgi:hypothetical protein
MPISHDIPITDIRLKISHAEIESLWEFGLPTTDSLALIQAGEPYIRAKRSENGMWHVKQFPLDFLPIDEVENLPARGLNPEQLCKLNDYELHRLRLLGLHVLTFARLPLMSEKNIMTVAPWIDGMEDISTKDYFLNVEPLLRLYFEEWIEEHVNKVSIRPFYILDSEQFSTAPQTSNYFLHDTDPIGENSFGILKHMEAVKASMKADGLF